MTRPEDQLPPPASPLPAPPPPAPPPSGGLTRLWKPAALLAAVAVLGVPIDTPLRLAVFVVLAIGLTGLPARPSLRRALAMLAVTALAVAALAALPRASIEEGHNVFLVFDERPGGQTERALRAALPGPIYADMSRRFAVAYPRRHRCPGGTTGCWAERPGPDRPFAFSADAVFQKLSMNHPAMSRRVLALDFDSLAELRAGFVNDHRYNWYEWSSDVTRRAMPFFVRLELDPRLVGGRLCWRGHVYLPDRIGFRDFDHADMACRPIDATVAAGPIIGSRIAPDETLAMRLDPPSDQALLASVDTAVRIAGALAVLLLATAIPSRAAAGRLAGSLGLAAVAALVVWVTVPDLLGRFPPHIGGDDGLTHEGYGRVILQAALAGDWTAALMGVETAYYYQPGLRYARALERVLFGDSNLGYLAVLLALPWAVRAAAQPLVGHRIAWAVALAATATPLLSAYGASLADYAVLAARGYAEPLGYALFLAGLAGLLRLSTGPVPAGSWALATATGLALALAVWMRVNLSLAAALLVLVGIAMQWRRAGPAAPAVWMLLVGFAPVGLMLVHNLVFAGAAVPLTTTGRNVELLLAPPTVWAEAASALLRGDVAAEAVDRVAGQAERWLGPWHRWPLPAALALLLLWPGRVAPAVRLTAATAAVLHLGLLFYVPDGRYAWMAWTLTGLALAGQLATTTERPRDAGPARAPQRS